MDSKPCTPSSVPISNASPAGYWLTRSETASVDRLFSWGGAGWRVIDNEKPAGVNQAMTSPGALASKRRASEPR
jgi:hypothetical protein